MNKYKLARSILCLGLTVPLLVLLLSQPLLAQTSLPACTAEIADLDRDGTNDNDGADGIIDIDKDGDGLIEICDLEGLNEMRYQLDGSGYKASADAITITQGCPTTGCRGYELVKDLDFNADTSYRTTSNKVTWTTGGGWSPIGPNRFSGVFEGNGHTIAHLYINRIIVSNVGLFAVTDTTAKINNIKLFDVNVTGIGSSIAGSLVGLNNGSIINSDVTGTVNSGRSVGGLVGDNNGQITLCVANVIVTGVGWWIGGLVGLNNGVISESRASGNVIGSDIIGGLVGWNHGGIANTYATGNVSANTQVGGLVGRISSDGSITNSYAIGKPRGSSDIGGLVGFGINVDVVTASYWDKTINADLMDSANAKTTTELQSPIAPGTTSTAIYYGWSEEIWDFGSTNTYPLLRSAGSSTVDGLEVVIDKDGDGLIEIYDLEGLNEMRHQLDGSGHKTSASGTKSTQGCPESGCIGYELMKDLDFNADASYLTTSNKVTWTTGSGWSPIGSNSNRFSGIFEGNGHTIANLYIDRNSNNIGLFAVTADTAKIQNIKLLNATIQGAIDVGSLVGSNFGLIINSDVTTATIVGNSQIGGLVGRNMDLIINSYAMSATVEGHSDIGGLVGANRGDIISSFAYTNVIGFSNVGGLVGDNTSNITNTYAAGTISSTQTVSHAGGLVGVNGSSGSIKNSYTISQVMPLTDENSQVGGLVGDDSGSITASYWYKTVNADLMTSDGDGAKTTAELQTPTAPGATSADTYYGWRTTAWDFGDSTQYPTLYYATTDSITVSACADNATPPSALPRCGSRIPNQAVRNLIPDFEVSEITISSQPSANADGTINEGSNVRLMVNATGESESYSYVWSQISGKALSLTTTDTATLNVAIAPDFVEQDATTAVITFQVAVSDGVSTISRSATITIKKINNRSNFDIEVDVSRSRLRIITTGTDADGAGSFSYQWQQLVSGGWTDITDATTATYWLPGDADDRIQYRVELMHTDGQGYTTEYPIQGPFRARLDDDNDGLIDIYTLEDLDAIRNQYSNIPTRCGSNSDVACNGFELRRSLDFNAADSYQSGMTDPDWTTSTGSTGWLPIGSVDEPFNRVFDGNGFTISGLYINRPQSTYVGLFSVSHSEIKNIGLLDVNIIGGNRVGGLVGWSGTGANIINSYVTGAVAGTDFTTGGLVGSHFGSILNSYANGTVSGSVLVGGLIGYSEPDANIINSYASGAVSGEGQVGGLVGHHRGRLRNVYATGDVSLTSTSDNSLGGLVGNWEVAGSIRNSYAIGRVIPGVANARDAGGLIGTTTGTAVSSYWDGKASGWNISAGGDAVTSRTTMELQSPTAPGATAMDVYYGWRVSDWDFGDDEEYPVLRYIAGGMNACNAELSDISTLPQCGNLLPNQGRTADFAVSEVTISSQPAANNDDTINEGSNISLRVNVIGGSEDYNFVWSQTSGQSVVLTTTDTATLNVAIAPDFVEGDATTAAIAFQVKVGDGSSTISRSKMITITRIDNGTLAVEVDVNPERLRIISTEADPDGSSGVFSYQWQKQELGGEWENIEGATTATYGLPADASASVRYRVTISYTDDQGYPTEYQSRSFRGSLDDDGDGLIDIYTLEDLDNIRNQYASMPSTCAADNDEQCRGFELRRSLDFNAVDSYQSNTINTEWTTGRGWTPIGFGNATTFDSLFDGNGYTLSGLQIDSSGNGVALFSAVGATGQINNIGLLGVDVSGRSNVGSLVGENYGSIINSYATGEVSGSANNVGGLVGLNGYTGSVLSSFATAEVSGSEAVGGLVGWHTGRITNSYASGTVSLTGTSDLALGGLVGQVGANDGAIINSYAISRVMPGVDNAREVGGLVGITTGTVIASYWNTQTSEQSSSAGGDGAIPRTTVQLQSPTAPGATPMDSYYGWDSKIWDFGDNNHYPALRYTSGGLDACNDDITLSSMRPLCGIPLPQQSDRDKGLGQLLVTAGDDDISEQLMPTFSPLRVNYEMLIVSTETVVQLTLRPYALNTNAMITITDQGGSSYFSGKPNGVLSDPIMLSDSLTLTIVVTDNIAESMVDTTYILTISKIAPLAISGVMLSATMIAEGSTATVTFDVSGGTGIYQYAYKLIADEDEIALPSLAPPAVLMMPIDIVAAADDERAVELNIIVSDDSGRRVEHDEALTIEKVDNGLAEIEAIRATSRTVTVKVSGDPDGDADDLNYAYQWQWSAAGGEGTAQWTEIEGATDASYDISDDLAVINNEFRAQVMYTDNQAYQATLTSNAVRYDFLPSCTMAIADSDGDDAGATIDIDKDGDGLIELCDLEGINEMRYQLDGNGYKTSEGATSSRRGCPLVDGEEQCRGYELVQSLDFNEVASYRENTMNSAWTAGSGWLPIEAGFASVFEGNGHSIANLYINQTEAASGSKQGLFSTLAATAQINNIQLLDVNIQGFAQVATLSGSNSGIIRNSSASGEVMANSDVGGLVGRNDGHIISSFATVAVTANMNGGGLVGHNQGSLSDSQAFGDVMGGSRLGGLSGVNDGSIISSYATATVNGSDTSSHDIGGLVGHNNNVITNSYATGAVSATGNNIGGLVGFNNNGRIVNTYAEGGVMGASQVGGLIGRHHGSLMDSYVALGVVSGSGSDIGGLIGIINTTATVIASYWDSDTSGQVSSAGGESKTTAELQTATAPGTTTTAVYYNWSDNDWDFGDSSHYPALHYASDDDLNSCVIDITTSTMALPCTILLSGQSDRDKGLSTIFFFSDDLSATVTTEPLFSPLTNSYMVTIVTRAEKVRLTLKPYAINPAATITVTDPADNSYFADKATGALSDGILFEDDITLSIVVSDILGEDTVHTTYTFSITSELPPLIVSDLSLSVQPPANTDGTINEGSMATLTFDVSGGTGVYQYEFTIDDDVSTLSTPLFMYSIADDFIATDATTQTVRLTIRVSDQSDKIEDFEHTEVLPIRKTNNGSADINLSISSATLTAIIGADPDGDATTDYQYQWQAKTGSDWMNIEGATDASYTIGDEAKTSAEYRVQVMYIDGQKYQETPISNEIRYTPPSELPPLMVSDIQLSVQPSANADGTINEGSMATLTFEVSGGTDDYQYESKIDDAEYTSFEPPFMYSIADDFIAADTTSQMVTLAIRVSDQSAEIEDLEYTEELHILKTNNGSADINISISSATLTAIVGADPDGDVTTPNYTYQWQTKTGSEWMNIGGADDTSYTISGDLASASGEFRVQVMYTDGQGYPETPISNAIRYIPPSELQPLMVSDIMLSFQPSANADGTINEGSMATLTFEVSGGTGVYQYASKIDDAEYTSFEPPFMYSIADDFIAADTTSQMVTLTIRVSDQSAEIEDFEYTEELHILKTNNGSADINLSISSATLTAIVGADPDGDPNPVSYTYQWQAKTGSEWMDIDDADDASYAITADGEFRVQVTYTDGQSYLETPISNAITYTRPDSSGLRIRTKVFLEGPLR